jgi:hypothetical protein
VISADGIDSLCISLQLQCLHGLAGDLVFLPITYFSLHTHSTSYKHYAPLPRLGCLSSDLRHRSPIPYWSRLLRRGHHSEQRALERRGKRLFAGKVQVPPL